MNTKRISSQTVLDAINDLHNQEQVVTRDILANVLGVKMVIIDDHVGRLINDGLVRRVRPGVFVPVPTHAPARPISRTILGDGREKIEIGDQILELTPKEARALAQCMGGSATQYSQIQLAHEFGEANADMRATVLDIARQLADLRESRGK